MSYADYLDTWTDSLDGILKETTVENYRKKINLYIKPHIGNKRLCSISKDDVRELLKTLATNGCKGSDNALADTTLSVVKGIIQKSLSQAVEDKLLIENPITGKLQTPSADNILPDKPAKKKPHVYIKQDMIDEIFGRFSEGTASHIPMMLGYKCGLRIGEAYAVTWDDIDFQRGTITVNKQVQWHQTITVDRDSPNRRRPRGEESEYGMWYLTTPKYNSVRTIRIDTELAELLIREKERQMLNEQMYADRYIHYHADNAGAIRIGSGENEIKFVNVRFDGEFISPRTMQHTSRIIHEKIGFKEFDFHSLRHTHATMLAENGATPMYVKNRLGHKNVEVTLRVYYHYTEKMDSAGNDVLMEMFNKSSTLCKAQESTIEHE